MQKQVFRLFALIGIVTLLSSPLGCGGDGDSTPPANVAGFSNLPDTGVTECYDNAYAIECPSPGQPFYGQDAQYVTNPMSFTVNLDGTVTDNVTGLMWQREDDNQARNWESALTYCMDLDLAGHTDWRLPNEYELQSIMDYARESPAIDTTVFPGTNPDWYWSSSTYARDHTPRYDNGDDEAWFVHFEKGTVNGASKTNTYYVRCVRGESIAQSFTDNHDGTVTDNVTRLMWQQEDLDLGTGNPNDDRITWEDSLAYCEDLVLGGHADWRLPDVKELRSIVDYGLRNPAIDSTYFPGTITQNYWSSSTYARDHHYTDYAWGAWCVFFTNGAVLNNTKWYCSFVRCVR